MQRRLIDRLGHGTVGEEDVRVGDVEHSNNRRVVLVSAKFGAIGNEASSRNGAQPTDIQKSCENEE